MTKMDFNTAVQYLHFDNKEECEAFFSSLPIRFCYSSLSESKKTTTCLATFFGFEQKLIYQTNSMDVDEFVWGGTTFSIFTVLGLLFNSLPETEKKDIIEKYYRKTKVNHHLKMVFHLFLEKRTYQDMKSLVQEHLQFQVMHSKLLNYHLTYNCKALISDKLSDFTYHATIRPISSETLLPNGQEISLYNIIFIPLEEKLATEFPGISFAHFSNVNRQGKYSILTFLSNTYKESEEYKLKELFNTKEKRRK